MTDYAEIMEEFEDSLSPLDAETLAIEMREGDALPDRFTPTTDQQFEWALRKRARAITKRDELQAALEAELYQLNKAFDRRIAEHANTAAFFTDMVERGIEAMEPDDKGKRTVKTVAGTVYTRTAEHFDWPDDEMLVGWAREHLPEAVRVKESPDRTALKTHVKETGEVPDGVTVESVTTVVIKSA
ncbi:MAG: host-nuclease inhibitor Gam family protein [Actinomycetes bacterium]